MAYAMTQPSAQELHKVNQGNLKLIWKRATGNVSTRLYELIILSQEPTVFNAFDGYHISSRNTVQWGCPNFALLRAILSTGQEPKAIPNLHKI